MKLGLAVLIYHRVGRSADPLRVRMPMADEFRAQMRVLSRFFRPVALAEGLRRLQAGTLPGRSVAVTFDDGYADNAAVALPILREEGVPASFFVATAYLDGGRMWNDTVIEAVRRMRPGEHPFPYAGLGRIQVPQGIARHRLVLSLLNSLKYLPQSERQEAADALEDLAGGGLPTGLMMRREDVVALSDAGMDVGGHTRTHPILASLTASEAEDEIAGGLDELAAITRRRPAFFAYPNGQRDRDYGDREVGILRRIGVEAALVTNRGIVRRDSDPLQAPRLSPVHRGAARFAFVLWRANSEPDWRPEPVVLQSANYDD